MEVVEAMNANEQRHQFARMVLEQNLDLDDVWLRYFAMTGNESKEDVFLYAVRMVMLPEAQRDLLLLAARDSVQDTEQDTDTLSPAEVEKLVGELISELDHRC